MAVRHAVLFLAALGLGMLAASDASALQIEWGKRYNPGGVTSTAPLQGWVDLHTHPMAHLGFGGKLIHGAPDVNTMMPAGMVRMGSGCNPGAWLSTSITDALGSCAATHGGWDALSNTCGNMLRSAILGATEKSYHNAHGPGVTGSPAFLDWPRYNDITHQSMWIDWVERAYKGGQRVLVALAVNSVTMAKGLQATGAFDDRSAADLQIGEMKRLVARHPWMQIAYSASDLRRIVHEDKLAIILGVELDDLGNFLATFRANRPSVTDAAIESEVARLYQSGVRYVFPVHVIDNAFGGTATYENNFNTANRYHFGRWWELECADSRDPVLPLATGDSQVTWRHQPQRDFENLIVQAGGLGIDLTEVVPVPNCAAGVGHQNSRGLQRRGKVLLRALARRGMLIDVDHGSRHTVDGILTAVEPWGYPVLSGHNGFALVPYSGARTESERTASQYARIGKLDGMGGVGWGAGSTSSYAADLQRVRDAMNGRGGVTLGSDANGMVSFPGPPGAGNAAVIYDASFPRAQTLARAWDYNMTGVAHYGLVPDFLRAVETKGGATQVTLLLSGAEALAVTWARAEAKRAGVPTTTPKAALGEDCDGAEDCQSNRCDRGPNATRTNRCISNDASGPSGTYCTTNKQCRTGVCRLGVFKIGPAATRYGRCS